MRLVTQHRAECATERAVHIQVASDEREELKRLRAVNKRLREVDTGLATCVRRPCSDHRPPRTSRAWKRWKCRAIAADGVTACAFGRPDADLGILG